jgi:hypothetical protein
LKRSDFMSRLRAFRLLGLLVLPLVAAGCGVSKLSSPFGSSEADSDRLPEQAPADQLTQITSASSTGSTQEGSGTHCPQVVAWPRDRLVTVYQGGNTGDAKSVIHRGEITKMSRECQFYGGRVVVKYGVAGRVLLGPKGGPGRVSFPMNVRVAGSDQRTLATDRMVVAATIPHDAPVGYFSMVREIAFPIMVGARPEDYKIFVAFAQAGGQG